MGGRGSKQHLERNGAGVQVKGQVRMDERTTVDRPEADSSRWESVLDQLTKEHEGEEITIELLDPTFGDADEVERLPFAYVNYDRPTDTVIIAVGGKSAAYPVVLRHMIHRPVELAVDDSKDVAALKVVDADGTATLVSFRGRPD
jgi:hypothetical protein